MWVLRDFSKDLGLDTSEDYMEAFLKNEGISDIKNSDLRHQEENMNKLKKRISDFFEKRSCFTLPKPLEDGKKIKKIDEVDDEDLTPNFTADMRRFLQYMSLNISPKSLNKNSMTGNVFQSYVYELVNVLNSGEIPFINSLAGRLFDNEAKTSLDDFLLDIDDYVEEFKMRLPMSEVKLHKEFDKYINKIIHEFKDKTEVYSSTATYARNQEFLLKNLTDNFDILEEENITKSIEAAENTLNQFVADYKIPNIVNKESMKRDMIQKMKSEFINFTRMFISKNKGPKSSEKCLEIFPEFLFESFDSIYQRVIDVFEAENKDLTSLLTNTNSSHERIKDFMKEQEQAVIDLNKTKTKLEDEIDALKNEIEKMRRTHKGETEVLLESNSKLEELIDKKKRKNEDLDSEIRTLKEENSEFKGLIDDKNREIENLKKKVESGERVIMEYSNSLKSTNNGESGENSDETAGLYEMIKYLNQQVENLNNEVKSRNQAKLSKITLKLEAKEKEIKELLEERKKTIIDLREEYTKKIKDLRTLYEDRIQDLEAKIKEEYAENKNLQSELFDKKKTELELKRAQILKGELEERIKTLEESNKAKDMKSEINQETFTKFIKQIEIIKLEKSSYEDKLMKYKEQALTTNHEIKNIVNCVNNVVTRSRDKNVIVHMIKKLTKESRAKLGPFFKQYKIKV